MSAQAQLVPRSIGSLWATRTGVAQTLSQMTTSRRRRSPYLRLSPSRVLALRLKCKAPEQLRRYDGMFKAMAALNNERLPLITLQSLLRRQDLSDEKETASLLRQVGGSAWKDRLSSLASRGWLERDVEHWAWILSGESADARIQRFAASDSQKPVFLLMLLVQNGQAIRSAESLKIVLEYVNRNYCQSPRGASSHGTSSEAQSRHSDLIHGTNLSTSRFLVLLRRLIRHASRIWPSAMISIAELVQNRILSLPEESTSRITLRTSHGKGYHDRCVIFNTALHLLSTPASMHPIQNMIWNWRAQKRLLSMSDAMTRPLAIDRLSYRAIRKVMIAQKKSATERYVAMRYSKSWPPYRQDFDGHDVNRTLQDDQSRSVKAGVLMEEAGYEQDEYDRALGALGGMTSASPTVQTRSLAPKEWKRGQERDNFYSLWAMKIRATRNSHEAWRLFNTFSDLPPNIQVYAEMFMKLRHRSVGDSMSALPGDVRETFPIHDGNFSDSELARLTPPTVDQLYKSMISHRIKPRGICLQFLVSTARSVEEGLRYLRDGALDPVTVSHLALYKEPAHNHLRKIPLLVFNSYIQLLCRLQPDRRGRRKILADELIRIRHAIKLVTLRLVSQTTEGATFRPPWHAIYRALARPHVAVTNGEQLDNDLEALRVFLDVLARAEKACGIDPEALIFLCRTTQKLASTYLSMSSSDVEAGGMPSVVQLMKGDTQLGRVLNQAHSTVITAFARLTRPITLAGSNLSLPDFQHVVTPIHLHAYMRTLASVDDVDRMVDTIDWMLTNKSHIDQLTGQIGPRSVAAVVKTLCAFHAFAVPRLSPKQRSELDARLNSLTASEQIWRWPTAEEVQKYVESDARGGSLLLQQRALAGWWQQAAAEQSAHELEQQQRSL